MDKSSALASRRCVADLRVSTGAEKSSDLMTRISSQASQSMDKSVDLTPSTGKSSDLMTRISSQASQQSMDKSVDLAAASQLLKSHQLDGKALEEEMSEVVSSINSAVSEAATA